MIRYYSARTGYTLDRKHGFGILFNMKEREVFQKVFYADGSLLPGEKAHDFGGAMD